jgi:hypothetical protein
MENGLFVALEHFFPTYRVTSVDTNQITDVSPFGETNRVALCQTRPDVTVRSAHEFVTRNPSCLFVSIGTRSKDGLRESALAGATQDPETSRLWQAIFRAAESSMHIGATVRNPLSGATERLPLHRHTTGAHQLAEQGTRMLAAAGWNEITFDDCGPLRGIPPQPR